MQHVTRLSRYFRISLTSECNLSCYFCHNEGQERLFANRDLLSLDDIVWICGIARDCGFAKFKLTGGEPTLRGDITEIVSGIRALGIDDLSMITNGTCLKALARDLRTAGLPRLNVSFFTLDKERFTRANGAAAATLDLIISGIDEAINAGFTDLKLNYVWHHRNLLDDFLTVAQFASERDVVLAVLPLLDEYGVRPGDERTSLQMIYQTLQRVGIDNEHVDFDGESIRRRLIHLSMGAKVLLRMEELGEVGPYSDCTYCPKRQECRESIYPVRLGANGVLRPCLAEGRPPQNLYGAIKSRDFRTVRKSLESIFSVVHLFQENEGRIYA